MHTTLARRVVSSRGRQRIRPSWMSPGLSSHQQLDAGIAARQQAGRKDLKKAKRPFDNYFRTQFRFSPRVHLSRTHASGLVSSYDAVVMMTDPRQTWAAPWDRGGSNGALRRRKRQDVLEPTHTAFGEDALDPMLERLLEIRFAWDREDGVLCTSLVPVSLYGATAHCRPYLSEVTPSSLTSSTSLASSNDSYLTLQKAEAARNDADGEVLLIAGTPVRIQRRSPLPRHKSGQPKRPHTHSTLGFSGVDAVPSLVLDVSHGPFLSSPNAPLMTSRWKGEHREATSVQRALHLLRRVRGVPAVALTARASFLLLKALSSVEVEEPALAVSVAIAIGENYNSYSDTERLEVLRCLRRLALVRGLPDLATPDIDAVALAAAGGSAVLPGLYADASLTESLLAQYLRDAAPFLVGKVWACLPEQSRHLLQQGYFLDWFDLMRLAIAASGPRRLPERLPNPVTEAPYAAKFFFFHHTLGLRDDVLRAMVVALRGAPTALGTASSASEGSSGNHAHPPHTASAAAGGSNKGQRGAQPHHPKTALHYVDEVREEVDRPLILWLCASLLVRIVAESLGDVVRHVGDLLHQHAALAAERAEEEDTRSATITQREVVHNTDGAVAPPPPLPHAVCHPYPRFSSGAYQQIGCRKPKRVRVRLLPFEAFPRVAQCFSCPYASVTEEAEARERQRSRGAPPRTGKGAHERQSSTSSHPVAVRDNAAARPRGREVQSTFAAVLAESPRMVKQIERACAALTWSTSVLQSCRELVRDLPAVAAAPVAVSCSGTAPATLERKAAHFARGENEWARETVAIEVRHALCYRHVRSAVQLHMDALFAFLPWAEIETRWGQPMLTAGDDCAAAESNDTGSDTYTAGTLGALLDDAPASPAEPFSGGSTAASTTAASTTAASTTAAPSLSQAEQRARATMEELRECLEEFQVAVADLLEAHERFFDAPAKESTHGGE